MKKNNKHENYMVDVNDIITDVKILLEENYWANFTHNDNKLKVEFSNGQVATIQISIEK